MASELAASMSAPKRQPPLTPCIYCGSTTQLTIEHLVPLARGGTNGIANLAWSCSPCNNAKSCLTHDEYLDLRGDPVRLDNARRWTHRRLQTEMPKPRDIDARKQPMLTSTIGSIARLNGRGWPDP